MRVWRGETADRGAWEGEAPDYADALAIARLLLGSLRPSVRRAAESTDWPIVEGSVIGSSLKVIQDSNQHRFRPLVEVA